MSAQTGSYAVQATIAASQQLPESQNDTISSSSNTTTNTSNIPSTGSPPIRKVRRRRIPTSCSICRKRKIKCDKLRPHCSSCVKNLCTNLCSYQTFSRDQVSDNEQSSNIVLNKQIEDLKKHNAALQIVVNNYEKLFTKILTSKKDLADKELIANTLENSSVSLAKATFSSDLGDDYDDYDDELINNESNDDNNDSNANDDDDVMHDLVNSFDVLVLKEQHLYHFGSTSIMSISSNDPIISDVFSRFLNLKDTNNSGTGLCTEHTGHVNFFKRKNLVVQEFLKPINKILPSQTIFKKLIDRFFEKCYMMFNFIERDFFMEKMYQVTKSVSFKNLIYFEVSEKEELAMVGLALLVLRCAFLTLPLDSILIENGIPLKEQPWLVDELTLDCYRENVNISPIFVEHCKSCIMQSNLMAIVQLESVQVLLALKYYKVQSPEDGDCGLDFTHTNAYIIQMAKMAGLNRDPDNFDIIQSETVKHVWRKCWHALMKLDVIGSMEFGSELVISKNCFDTKLPIYKSSMTSTEKKVIDNICLENEAVCILRKISETMITVTTVPRYSQVIRCLKELKQFIDNKLPNYDDFSNFKVKIRSLAYDDRLSFYEKYCLKINMQLYYYVLSYILMLTSGPTKPEMKEKYLRITIGAALEIFHFSYHFVNDSEDLFFGKDLKNMAVSKIFLCSLKAYQMICIIVVRQYENFEETFTITGVNKNQYLSEQVIHWLTKNKQEISEVSGVPINDFNKIMSFQLYAYVEEVYSKLIRLADKFYLSWKFKKFVIMFVVYLLDKYPIYKEFSNNLYNKRQNSLYNFSGETNNNCNNFNIAKQDYDKLDTSNLKSVPEFYAHLEDVKMFEGINNSGEHWFKMIDDAGRLKYNYFKPFFGDDYFENCEDDSSPPTDKNSYNHSNTEKAEYMNEPLGEVLIDDQTLDDINKYFANASSSLGIDLRDSNKGNEDTNTYNFINNNNQLKFKDELSSSNTNNNGKNINYNNGSIPSLVTPSSTGREASFSSEKRNQFDVNMDSNFNNFNKFDNIRTSNSHSSDGSNRDSSKHTGGFGFMFQGGKAPQSINIDDESPSEVHTHRNQNQNGNEDNGLNLNIEGY